jgi:Helix-turn-helix domain
VWQLQSLTDLLRFCKRETASALGPVEGSDMQQLALAGTIPFGQNSDRPSTLKIRSARSQNRASAWIYDLNKWRAYQLSRATSEAQIAAIEAQYARLREMGPDFTGYHTGSDFREPPMHNLTREDRVRILASFDGIRAGLYKHCREERGQAVSKNYREVLGVLLSFAVKRRRVFPSLETIARMAMVSKQTVLNALAWLAIYGFLDRLRRIVRTTGLLGPRVRQTSNAYVMCFPKGLGGLAASVFGFAPEHNNWTPSESKSQKEEAKQGSAPRSGAHGGARAPQI